MTLILERKYLPSVLGNWTNLIIKIGAILFAIFLIFGIHYDDFFLKLIFWFFSLILILWSSGFFLLFQRIEVDDHSNIKIINFFFFKDLIKKDSITKIESFQTFFDKKFNTFSLRIFYKDEDNEEDELVIFGLHKKFLIKIKSFFSDKYDASKVVFNKEDDKFMANEKSDLILETIEKKFRRVWIFNWILLLILISLFVVLFAYRPLAHVDNSSLYDNSSAKYHSSALMTFKFNNSELPDIVFKKEKGDKLSLNFILPTSLESISAFKLKFLDPNNNVLFIYYDKYENNTFTPTIAGKCLLPGVVNTQATGPKFKVTLKYNVNYKDCLNINKVKLIIIYKDNSSKEYIAISE